MPRIVPPRLWGKPSNLWQTKWRRKNKLLLCDQLYSLLLDETDDVSLNKVLSCFARFVHPDTGHLCTRFLGITYLENGTGETVATALGQIAIRFGLSITKAVALGCDGASAMYYRLVGEATCDLDLSIERIAAMASGKRAASARVLLMNLRIVLSHCALHKLSLAVLAAANYSDYARTMFLPNLLQNLLVF